MINTKLVDLLGSLEPRERSRFRQYVHSPFFNRHRKLMELCDYLIKCAPEFRSEELNKRQIDAILHPEEIYNEDRFNNLISDLLHLLYDFLAQLEYEQEEQRKQLYLLNALLERDKDKHFERIARKFSKQQARRTERSFKHFGEDSEFNELQDRYAISKKKRDFNVHLQQASDALDIYFWLNKFRIACDMCSRNIVIKAAYQSRFLAPLLQLFEQHKELNEIPSIQIYYQALQLLNLDGTAAHYRQLKALLARHADLLPAEELQTLYNYALNFCIRQINSGDATYYREIFELYKAMIGGEIIFINGYLSQWSYKNIITTSLRLNEFVWTEQFIHTYKERLLPEIRENAFTYNLAAYHYAKGDYASALIQLHNVDFTDPSYHLGAKIIQLKSYYELDETEALYSLVEAFQKYLSRNRQISDYRKRANKNLIKLTKKIYKFRMEQSTLRISNLKTKLKQLHQLIEETEPLANKSWLKEVLRKLEGLEKV